MSTIPKKRKIIFILLLSALPILLTCTQFSGTEVDRPELGHIEDLELIRSKQFETTITIDKNKDVSLALIRNSVARDHVMDFLTALTGDPVVTEAIIQPALETNVSLSTAFALAWVESRFTRDVVSRNYSSIDRGLFQLNSKSFPGLTEAEFFDPYTNARYGIEYLQWCIDHGGNEIVALAMYNAGKGRVEKGGTPRITLDYISLILDYKQNLEENLLDYLDHVGITVQFVQNQTLIAFDQ